MTKIAASFDRGPTWHGIATVSARKRMSRRILRALRGATGPRDKAPLGGPMLAQLPARKASIVEFALTSRGHRIMST